MRSDLLVHWTGKDIPTRGTDKNGYPVLDATQEVAYLNRLRAILNQGIWMTVPTETMFGNGGSSIRYQIPMVCFTENRLSVTLSHALRYGLLGIAVDRRFVLDRNGGPVHYVRNNSAERLVAESADVGSWIKKTVNQPQDQYVADAYYYMISFLKAMSNAADDFTLLDENEWRLAFTEEAKAAGHIVPSSASPGSYAIKLIPNDIRLVVFPTPSVLKKAAADAAVAGWFQQIPQPPVFLTIRDCAHF